MELHTPSFHREIDQLAERVLVDRDAVRRILRVRDFAVRRIALLLNSSNSAVDVVLTLRDLGDALAIYHPHFRAELSAESPETPDKTDDDTHDVPDDDDTDNGDDDDNGDDEAAA